MFTFFWKANICGRVNNEKAEELLQLFKASYDDTVFYDLHNTQKCL